MCSSSFQDNDGEQEAEQRPACKHHLQTQKPAHTNTQAAIINEANMLLSVCLFCSHDGLLVHKFSVFLTSDTERCENSRNSDELYYSNSHTV